MANQTSQATNTSLKSAPFGAAREADRAGMRLSAYRCQCCGCEVAFDSLAACCECTEESYAERWSAPPMQRGKPALASAVSMTT